MELPSARIGEDIAWRKDLLRTIGCKEITAEHARVLGKYFALSPGAFIE